jgi:16S rRNA (guanine527-N7)-methyltransferase
MASLVELLGDARRRGFLGPGPVERQLAHAERFADLIGDPPSSFLDLGSGGGLPGLVLAQRWHRPGVLLDANERRCDWLDEALQRLGAAERVAVRCGRAEVLARDLDLREAFALVSARSFGPPPATAECGVGFLAPGGALIVSEPPEGGAPPDARWPAAALRELGLEGPETHRVGDVGIAVLRRVGPLATRWPRRTGVPTKRPLWTLAEELPAH